MAVQTLTVTLGSSSEQSIAGNGLHGPLRVYVRNLGAGVSYLGTSPVSTGAGYQLTSADAPLDIFLMGGEQLFAYSTGTPTLTVMRTGATT